NRQISGRDLSVALRRTTKMYLPRGPYISLEGCPHVFQRRSIPVLIQRYDAICRNGDAEFTHVGVGGGEQHAVIACDARNDHSVDFQIAEQKFEWRRIKA